MAGKVKSKKKVDVGKKNIFNRRYLLFLIPAAYFIIMTIVSFTYHKIGDYAVETDFYWAYIPQAKELLNGRLEIDNFRGPVYQIVLAIFGLIFGKDFFSAGMFINLVSAAIVLFLVYKIIETLSDWKIAAVTSLFVSVNQYFLQQTYSCGTDMLFMLFYFLAIYYLFKTEGTKQKNIFLAGVFSGIAYLTRYTGLALIISITIILLIALLKRDEKTGHKSVRITGRREFDFKPLLYYLVPFVILFVAWGLICLNVKGRFFFNDNYLNTALVVYKPPPMPNDEWTYVHAPAFKSMFDVVGKNPGMFFFKIFIENFAGFYVKNMHLLMPVFAGVLVSVGIAVFLIMFRHTSAKDKWFFLISFVFYLFPLLAFYSERFMLPLLPFYFYMLFKLPGYEPIDKLVSPVLKKYAVPFIAVLLIGSTFFLSYKFIKDDIDLGPKEVLAVSDYLKTHYKGDLSAKIMMARKPHIAYHTNTTFVSIPYVKTYEDLLKALRDARADFLFMSFIEVLNMGSQFNFLLDPANCPKELAVLISTKNPNSVLYRVKSQEEINKSQ